MDSVGRQSGGAPRRLGRAELAEVTGPQAPQHALLRLGAAVRSRPCTALPVSRLCCSPCGSERSRAPFCHRSRPRYSDSLSGQGATVVDVEVANLDALKDVDWPTRMEDDFNAYLDTLGSPTQSSMLSHLAYCLLPASGHALNARFSLGAMAAQAQSSRTASPKAMFARAFRRGIQRDAWQSPLPPAFIGSGG